MFKYRGRISFKKRWELAEISEKERTEPSSPLLGNLKWIPDKGEGRLLKESGTGVWALGGWDGRGECFFTSSLVQDIQQVENWHHQETLDETLYSTSSLPFIKFSTSHLQEVSTFDVINSLNAFNPSNVNCQIYVDGPVDVWQCGRVPQNPSGCIEIDRTAHVGWGGGPFGCIGRDIWPPLSVSPHTEDNQRSCVPCTLLCYISRWWNIYDKYKEQRPSRWETN